ncbi:hypothetical protein [Pseudomonas simiae]
MKILRRINAVNLVKQVGQLQTDLYALGNAATAQVCAEHAKRSAFEQQAATDPASGCNLPSAPGAAGVVYATRRAQLDPAHSQRIIAITDAGDQGLIALRACQAYVRAIAP